MKQSVLFRGIAVFLSFFAVLSGTLFSQVPTGENLDFSTGTYQYWRATTGNYYPCNSSVPAWNNSVATDDPNGPQDQGGKFFIIFNDPAATDSYTGNVLKKVPTHLGYTHSSQINNYNGDHNWSELKYTMEVNATNSLLTFNYAMILEAPGHTGYENPTFQIDVMKHNPANGAMLDELVDDCAFFEQVGDDDLPNVDTNWHSYTPSGAYDPWVWCNWQQIKINLAKYEGDRITIRVRLGDCCMSAHGAYGYFVAKAEPALIDVPGCAGNGDTVTVAYAPEGFDSYKWFEIPSTTLSQDELATLDESSASVADTRELVVTDAMMGNALEKFYAVKLVSPRTQDTRPNCVAYITTRINDIRPIFNLSYVQATPDVPFGETRFGVNDVTQSGAPLYWQSYDFGDGTTPLEIEYADGKWQAVNLDATTGTSVETDATGSVTTVIHLYAAAGTYTYVRSARASEDPTAEEVSYCEKSETLEVIVPNVPSLQLDAEAEICVGYETTVTASSPAPEDEGADLKYEWWHSYDDILASQPPVNEGTTYTLTLDQDTKFVVKVTNNQTHFYRIDSVEIKVQAFPDITLNGATKICQGDVARIEAVDATGNTVAMQWSFEEPSNPPVITNPSDNPIIEFTPDETTTVYLIAETSQGCIATKSVEIVVINPKVSATEMEICPGQQTTLIGSDAETYSWTSEPKDPTLNEGVQSTEPVTVSPEVTTTYTMSGYGETGCHTDRQITITVYPYPVATISYSPEYVDVDDPVLSLTDVSPNAVSSSWTFSDGGTSEARSLSYQFNDLSVEFVSIFLEASNKLGCSDTTSVFVPIELFGVWVPNAFSPNEDGSNDKFFFISMNNLEDVRLEIFNRQGTKLYSFYEASMNCGLITDMMNTLGWDGKYNGEYVPQGTYVYRLSYRRAGNTKVYDKTGTINVVR